MLPDLHGLAGGDLELALRGLLGDGAPLSASSIERLRAKWQVEHDAWKQRRLDDREVVYARADGVYVKAELDREKAASSSVPFATGTRRCSPSLPATASRRSRGRRYGAI